MARGNRRQDNEGNNVDNADNEVNAEEMRLEEEARVAEAARLAEIARLAEEARVAREAETARQAEAAQTAEANGAAGNGVPTGMDALMGMMAQVLARVPVTEGADPILNVAQGGGNQLPPYLKMLEHMRKLGTKPYPGGNDLMEAEEWRRRMERNFDSIRCPEQYKKDIAVHHLEGNAHLWWRGVVAGLEEGECTYEEFREKFQAKYFPEEAFDRLNAEFLELQQGSRTVREYEAKFNSLKVYAGREYETEKAQVRRFLRGLKVEIRNRCLVRNYDTVTELVEKAALLEEGIKEEMGELDNQPRDKGKRLEGSKGQRKNWTKNPVKNQGAEERTMCATCGKRHFGVCRMATGACHRCGNLGHRVRDCPGWEGKDEGSKRDEKEKTCYNCGEAGHIRPNCPKLGAQLGKRVNEGTAPPAKRQHVTPRVYEITSGTKEGGPSHPITGEKKE